jgi:predicted double-glycine peptidase
LSIARTQGGGSAEESRPAAESHEEPAAAAGAAASRAASGAPGRGDVMRRLAAVEVTGVTPDKGSPVPDVPTVCPENTIPLPQFRQSDGETCGVDSLMSVLAYYGLGDDPNEKDLRKELGTTYADGTEPGKIQSVAEKYGLNAEIKDHMTIDDLAAIVNKGTPVMVTYQAYHEPSETKDSIPGPGGKREVFPLRNPDGTWDWRNDYRDGHYSVVIGVDSKFVYLQDPSNGQGRSVIPRAEFDARWHDTDAKNRPVFDHTGIVLSPKKPPAELHPVYVRDCQYIP